MNIKQSALCEHLLQYNCMVNFDFIILAADSNKLKLLMWKSQKQDDKIVTIFLYYYISFFEYEILFLFCEVIELNMFYVASLRKEM